MKPHYVKKGGVWWVFKSRLNATCWRESLKTNTPVISWQPRKVIKTELGFM